MTNTRAPDWSIATHCGSVAPFERVQNSLAPDRTIVRPGQGVRSTSLVDHPSDNATPATEDIRCLRLAANCACRGYVHRSPGEIAPG